MDDVFPCIHSINSAFKGSIPLCFLSGLFIFLDQMDCRIDTFIFKRMGKCDGSLFIIGVLKSEREYILTISEIICRCLQLFHIIAVVDRQVCLIYSVSIVSGCCFFNQGIFSYHNIPGYVSDILRRIQSIDSSGQRVLCGIVLFHHRYACLLAVIGKGHISYCHFHVLPCIA